MSNEMEFRQKRRQLLKKIKNRKVMLLSAAAVIALIVVVLIVFAVVNNLNKEPEFKLIYNEYIYPQPLEKNFDILVDAQNPDGIKKAYLTFDDGPNNTVTTEVLDILRRYNIKATFFVVGSLIESNPGVARRIYDEGHFLANHSYSHKYNELYADVETFMSQTEKTQELIFKITDNPNYKKIYRFPGGSYNSGTYGSIKQECKIKLEENGYRHCDWNALSGDSEKVNPTEEYILSRIKKTVGQQEDVVVLMHDAVAKGVTAKTLPDVIDYLLDCGYEFDTLDNA